MPEDSMMQIEHLTMIKTNSTCDIQLCTKQVALTNFIAVNYMQPLVDQRKILQWETRTHAVKAQNCVTIYKNWCDSLGVYEVREKSRRFFD